MISQAMRDFVKNFIESHDAIGTKLDTRYPFRKLYGHCARCAQWARRLAVAEGADVEIAEVSTLFHDIGKSVDSTWQGHAEVGARICEDYLASVHYDAGKRAKIVAIVQNHIHHARGAVASLEAKVESDADLLDETGAMTVLWDAMAEAAKPDCSFDSAYERIATVSDKLKSSGLDAFHTATAREIALGRRRFLREFVDNLAYELGRTESPNGV
jgi:putative nucleotidyltransferase with HDIG domain